MPARPEIVGILLAAGNGSRFGGDKLLHPLPGGLPIGVAAAASLLPSCDRVVAVVRPGDLALSAILAEAGCEIAVCSGAEEGMGHSLAVGVCAAPQASGWIVALGDMPFIRTETHRAVAACLRSGARLAAVQYRARRGHPVGFAEEWFLQLASLTGDQGGKAILEQHRQHIAVCTVDDPGVILDIDRRADLADI